MTLRLPNHIGLNLIKALQRKFGPGGAKGGRVIAGCRPVLGVGQCGRAADSVAAGTPGVQGLPEKAQKGELEGPETLSGESPFVGLRETMGWNPGGAKQLELRQ